VVSAADKKVIRVIWLTVLQSVLLSRVL